MRRVKSILWALSALLFLVMLTGCAVKFEPLTVRPEPLLPTCNACADVG